MVVGGDSTSPRLVGRDHVIAEIDGLLERAGSAHGGSLLLDGIAGVGKTALLRHARTRADHAGFDVRVATGLPIEAGLPFGVLASLLAPERRDNTLTEQAPSVSAALGVHALAEAPSVLTVASEVLQLLSTLGRQRPVLLIVDDVQWVDASSTAVLGHVARHAIADHVAVIFARRTAEPERHDASGESGAPAGASSDGRRVHALDGVATITIEPLSHDDTVAALVAADYPRSEAERWALRCGGLPLAISELSRRRGLAGLDPGDLGALLPEVFRRRVAALPADVADAALHAAVCDDFAVLRDVGGSELVDALRRAEDTGLLRRIEDHRDQHVHVAFHHPLLRAAVLATAPRERERDVHRRVADALDAAGSIDRAAIHWASAADGPDDRASDALAGLAQRASARGALDEAAHAWIRAAALTTRPEGRAPLLTRAADALFDNGDAHQAMAVVKQAIASAADPGSNADARALNARMGIWTRSPKEAVRELVQVAADVRDVDPARAATALVSASSSGYLDGNLDAALARAHQAEELAIASGDIVVATSASASLAWSAFLTGDWEQHERRLEPLEPLMRALLAQKTWAGIHLAEVYGLTWVCAERWDEAEPLIRDLLHTVRTMGARLTVASTSLLLTSLSWRRGRWDEAAALALPLLEATDFPPITFAWVQVQVGQLLATMGRVDEARDALASGMSVARTADIPFITAIGSAALGHLELSLGNDELALAHLDRVAELTERIGFVEPEYFLWQGDHLEALVRMGRESEARDRLRIFAKLGKDGSRRWVQGVVARTYGQLTQAHAAADTHYEDALSCFDGLGMPFEVARTLLLRANPQDLADARRLFLRLGANVWVERASRRVNNTLGARGAAPASAADAPDADGASESTRILELLTPQERSVSLAVVSGRTNREIAAELHLSVKTIDHYLQRAYRRLGVKNRTELAMTVARALAAPRRSDS